MDILLRQGELLDLGGKCRGLTVLCHTGRLWITREGDPRDYILHDNSRLEISGTGQVIACAHRECRLELIPGDAKQSLPLWSSGVTLQQLSG